MAISTRISSLTMDRQGVNSILGQQYKLSKTEQQLATGKRILTPSDDPSDATRVMDFKKAAARTDQYQDNIVLGENRLEREDVAIQSSINVLQRIRELAVQGLNDTQGAVNRTSIAGEIRQRLDELLGLANSQDANGEYLFSGFQTDTEPFTGDPFQAVGATFTYNGDQGQRMSQISSTRQVPTGDPGSKLFMGIDDSTGTPRSTFDMLYEFVVDMEANTPQSAVLTNIDNAMERLTSVEAEVGARLHAIDSQRNINEDHKLSLQGAISDLEDLDYAEAISRMNLQLTGLQAAQQAYTKVQGLSLFNFL